MDSFMERYYKGNLPDVYQLRYEGLDRKLKDEELAQVLSILQSTAVSARPERLRRRKKRAEQY